MKVFVTPTTIKDIDSYKKVLQKGKIQYTDAYTAGFDRMADELRSCDAYMTFFIDPARHSLLSERELNMAMDLNLPVIMIKEDIGLEIACGATLFMVNSYRKLDVFDLTMGADITSLPDFIRRHVENCSKEGEMQDITEARKPDRPYTGNEPHIFVSYAHKDMNEVFQVIREMQNRGYRIWYDEGIDPASEWDQNIAEHVNSCSYMIAFISPNYIASQNCKDEISYARDLNKERLLVYLKDTRLPVGMAMRLMRLQAIHKYKYKVSSDFYDKLFAAQGISVAK